MKLSIYTLIAVVLTCSCSCKSATSTVRDTMKHRPLSYIYDIEPADPDTSKSQFSLLTLPDVNVPQSIEVKDKKAYLYMDTNIDTEIAERLVKQFDEVNARLEEISTVILEINSEGGELNSGFLISKAIERSKAKVHCVVDGQADSMAFYILQSCPKRSMTKRSILMMHQASASGTFSGFAESWKGWGDYLDASNNAMVEHVCARMRFPISKMKQKIAGGAMWWMGWEEAKKTNAIDHVVNTISDAEKL